MKRSNVLLLTLWCALPWLPCAAAGVGNRKTIVTLSGPVEVPGAVLEPGTYVIKLADSASNRNIVRIMNEDENRIHATMLVISSYQKRRYRVESLTVGNPERTDLLRSTPEPAVTLYYVLSILVPRQGATTADRAGA